MKNRIFPWLAFFIPLGVYLATLAPAITYGDNPELVAAAFSLGVPHPPGYPLFCLLGKLFSLVIPLGTVAARINLMSAVLGAAAVLMVFLIIREATGDRLAALAAALTLAFSRVFWLYSIQAEVFALNNFLLALVIYFAIKNKWGLSLFFLGLGLANQQSIILIVPALIFWFAVKNGDSLHSGAVPKVNSVITGILFMAAGLLVYLYLPWAAARGPIMNVGNPVNLKNFMVTVTRASYSEGQTAQLPLNIVKARDIWPQNLSWYFKNLLNDFSVVGIFFILLGIISLSRNRRKLSIFLFLAWFFTGPGMLFTNYQDFNPFRWSIMERLILAATLPLSIWIGFGLRDIRRLPELKKFPALVFLPALLLFSWNFSPDNFSRYYYGQDLADNILRSLEPSSILLTRQDSPTFHLLYLQIVEDKRPDVKLIFETPLFWQIAQYKKIMPDVDLADFARRQGPFTPTRQVWPKEIFLARVVVNNFEKFPIYSAEPIPLLGHNLITQGLTLKILANEKMRILRQIGAPEARQLAEREKYLWSVYHKRGEYSLEKVSPQTENVIAVYELARKFKEINKIPP